MTNRSKNIRATTRLVAGCMSGTSMDGIDAVLVRLSGSGLGLRLKERIACASHAFDPELSAELRGIAMGERITAGDLARLARRLGEEHAKLLAGLLGKRIPDLISVHGQTLFHRPPLSLQLMNAAPIAKAFGCPVLFDLRAADLASGGQGAPITPLADLLLYGSPEESRLVVNLGGFCNVTLLPATRGDLDRACIEVRGLDLCACNQLLDSVARKHLGASYDKDGLHASAGRAEPALLRKLMKALETQAESGRSLGSGDEPERIMGKLHGRLSGPDLAKSCCAAIARVVAASAAESARLILAGGGCANAALVAEIRSACKKPVILSDDLGIPFQEREAVAMAVLGALCQDRLPITLPAVTGCLAPAPVAGCWILP